jgi:DNA modification methylase
MSALPLSTDLFDEQVGIHQKFLPTINPINDNASTKSNHWDIPNTIKELSYLVHSHYRYYGKFPSVVAGQLLDQFPPPTDKHYVLDNFCGSGTTLVEAKLRGINSYGIDISWLSCLASNVKGNSVNTKKVKDILTTIINNFKEASETCIPPTDSFVEKWFAKETTKDLCALQELIKKIPASIERDFILVAYIGILRRVSKAFDAEVRPHINKIKKQRGVLEAFSKKIRDMCSNHEEYMQLIDNKVLSKCILSSNINLPKIFDDGMCHLVISHPPYLNSFNYTPVFSLEFYWGKPFEQEYTNGIENLHKQELVAHPASDKISDLYFDHLEQCYKETYRIQSPGAYLAVVIGDCTRDGILISVLDKTIDLIKKIGYTPFEFNYRSTHYGLGKYAYKHRADYHGDAEKKDGILIFKR